MGARFSALATAVVNSPYFSAVDIDTPWEKLKDERVALILALQDAAEYKDLSGGSKAVFDRAKKVLDRWVEAGGSVGKSSRMLAAAVATAVANGDSIGARRIAEWSDSPDFAHPSLPAQEKPSVEKVAFNERDPKVWADMLAHPDQYTLPQMEAVLRHAQSRQPPKMDTGEYRRLQRLLWQRRGTQWKSYGPHEYASVQLNLPSEESKRALALAAKVREEDLADDGREYEPHITVLYGVDAENPEDVESVVAGFGPVDAELGGVDYFANEGTDVLYISVEGESVHRLRRLLEGKFGGDGREYTPHVTLAYVKPGLGEKYKAEFNEASGAVSTVR
jgi:2'-5' RNA ligase